MVDVKIEKIIDHPDGTCTIVMEMEESTLTFLAKVGLMTLIENAAKETLDGYSDPEGEGDSDAGDRCNPDLFGEIPGL